MTIKQSTIKELWGSSENECAYPDCQEEIVDLDQGMVIGEMCHIKAQSPGGPRYDSNLDEDEVHEASNLLLLCPTHHTHIDKNPAEYPVEELEEWKENQTESAPETPELSDTLIERLVEESGDITVEDGSFIVTKNQMGGQVAHEITNIGPQPRSIPPVSQRAMVSQLSQYNPPTVEVSGLMGNGETIQLAEQIIDILENAGWEVNGPHQEVRTGNPTGIMLIMPEEMEPLVALGNLLIQSGLKAEGYLNDEAEDPQIVVGANL